MIVAKGPTTNSGGVHRLDRNIISKANAAPKPVAAACEGATATRTKLGEKMVAIDRTNDKTKRGTFTPSTAPNIIITTVIRAKMRFMINCAASNLEG